MPKWIVTDPMTAFALWECGIRVGATRDPIGLWVHLRSGWGRGASVAELGVNAVQVESDELSSAEVSWELLLSTPPSRT